MSWKTDEVRKVKITMMRPSYKTQDLSVTFEVNGSQKDEFQEMLLSYFLFIEKNEGIIKSVDEITDAETGATCELHVKIAGLNQGAFAQELQTKAQKFPGQVHEPR